MASHSSILVWKIPRTEKPGGLWSMAHKESETAEHACTQGKSILELRFLSFPFSKYLRVLKGRCYHNVYCTHSRAFLRN